MVITKEKAGRGEENGGGGGGGIDTRGFIRIGKGIREVRNSRLTADTIKSVDWRCCSCTIPITVQTREWAQLLTLGATLYSSKRTR